MGEAPGSMKRFSPDDAVSRKEMKGISVHESDLLAILKMSRELGELPDPTIVLAIEPLEVKPGDALSPLLSSRLEDYVRSVAQEIRALEPKTS
jgi:hydrogenase maturation protease